MKKHIGVIICGLFLAGCATQRPSLPEGRYVSFAKGWAGIHHCNASVDISPEIAALARTYIVSSLNPYTYDRLRIEAEVERQKQSEVRPSIQDCRELSATVYARKQQIDNQNSAAAIQQQNIQNMINATKSTNTYCNKIGTQVLCNSF